MPLHIATPLIHSLPLSRLAGRDVWLKMESSQPSGSFKLRGIGLACERHAARGVRRLVSSSGGNAGIAAAHAGRRLGLAVQVFVPETTTAHAKALIEQEGATVIVTGASWQEANAAAQASLGANDAFIHPFDDPLLWQGHASLIDEVAQAGLTPDAVVLAVGGGGLMLGVAEGMARAGWLGAPIIAAETVGADSLAQSVAAGHRVELPAIRSLASSLGARQVAERAFALTREREVRAVTVSDAQAVQACQAFLDDHRTLVEPACGAALAVVYGRLAELDDVMHEVLVVVCGGATTTAGQLARYAQMTAAAA